MSDLTLQDVHLAIGGEWRRAPDADPVRLGAVSTDTRDLLPGDIFVALKGARFDGAEYLPKAEQLGARCLITHAVPASFAPSIPTLIVPDTLLALGLLARAHRDAHRACVVGITGSNGKTTTRELTAAVLRASFNVLQNTANENNRVGVPKTLLRLSERHDFAVIEMGTNEPGEIAALAAIGGPNCGVLTSISESHLAGLGSIEGVIREKGELLAALTRDGIAIVNFDDPRCVKAAERANCRVVSYGGDGRCELRATEVRANRFGTHFVLNGRHEFRLPLHGTHNVSNALAAIAVGWVSGVPMDAMQVALRRVEPVGQRLEYREFGAIGVLDDSYNANPASTRAALATLGAFPCEGQRIAVLGDMLELGPESRRLHAETGWFGTTHAVDLVIAVGKDMAALAEAYDEHFMKIGRGCVWRFDSAEQAAAQLIDEARAGDLLLVKGSHGMHMERVVKAFEARYGSTSGLFSRPTLRERPVGDPLPEVLEGARPAA